MKDITIRVSDEVCKKIEEITLAKNLSADEVFRRAFNVYALSVKAEAEGGMVAVVHNGSTVKINGV